MVSVGDLKCHFKLLPLFPCEVMIRKRAGGVIYRIDSIMTDKELAYTGASPMQRKDQDTLSNQECL